MLIKRVCFLLIVQSLCVSCTRNRSLTFVIDDTLSMQDDIDQVLQAANKILDIVTSKKGSEIKDVVLVTFNDPEVLLRIKTSEKQSFLRALRNIVARNRENHDCPEYALSGIVKALEESRQESYIYVFTDASAKDHRRLNEVKTLCEKKQSQVVIVLTGDCRGYAGEELGSLSVYYEIARASNGQVFDVDKFDVKDIADTIQDMISDQRSVITSKVIPASSKFVPVAFTVDDKTEYVTIHTSGQNVELAVTDNADHSIKTEKKLWKTTVKMVKFNAPSTGTYYAWVRGNTEVTIVVYAATDFTFDHGFSEFVPKSLADTSKQPIADRPHHLSISVTDPEHSVYIKSAEILDMNERVLGFLPLKKTSGDFYITDKFKSPPHMFKIQVTGVVKKTGKEIKRISKTALEPQIPPPPAPKAPVLTITDGSSVDVDYAGDVVLTCKVSGYPTPRIWWTSADGTTISEKSNIVELPYDYISYLKLSNVRHPGTYYCRAQNKVDSEFSQIIVNPRSPFTVQTPPPGTIQAKYAEEKRIRCDISSSYPFDIQWKTPLRPSDYTLSANKKVLTIKSVDLSAQGRYECEASLKSDPRQKHVINTNVMISDVAPPTIYPTADTITVSYGAKVHIKCKISGGVPRPRVSWTVMKTNEDEYRELSVSDEELTVASATLEDAGTYHCTARNAAGYAAKTTKLIVQLKPIIVIEEGSKQSIAYGNAVQITCKIIANPLPKIGWRNSKGNKLASQDVIFNNEITSRLNLPKVQASETYTCYAENTLGTSASNIDVEMLAPFVVRTQPAGVISSKFGSKTDITCDVISDFPLRIKWYFRNSSGVSEVQTSGKYKLAADGTTLTILYTDVDAVGTYSCEASLANDDKQKVDFTTNVQIDDLTPPVLQNTHPKVITVKRNQRVKIPCTIVGGIPPPDVSWQVMKKGENIFTTLSATGEELVIDSVALSDAGIYRCEATNVKGQANKNTELIVQTQPKVVIEEGSKISVAYGSNVQITCQIFAFPLPKIGWKNSKGIILTFEEIKSKNQITSRLNLQKVQASETYTCYAENTLGTSASNINVEMLAPFVVRTQPAGVITAKFGSKTDITCDVKSDFPLRIRWYFKNSSGVSEVQTSMKYKLAADGTTLTILYTDVDAIGTYSCEAYLVNDDKQRVGFTTNVQIDDLTPPVLQNTHPKVITVKRNQRVKIPCTIVGGIPPPDVSWQVMKKGENIFTTLSAAGEELDIDSVALSDAGIYRCEATNVKGQANKNTELIVQTQPEVVIEEGSKISVAYGSNIQITCKIVAFPLPKVGWKNSKGIILTFEEIKSNNQITSRLNLQKVQASETYTCYAENTLGTSASNINVEMLAPFVVRTQPAGVITAKFGSKTDITCDVKSDFPLKIKWYFKDSSGVSEVQTSGKYKLAADGTTLTILYTDVDAVGTYSCEASLANDDKQKVGFTTNVQIDDLTAPVLQNTHHKVIIVKSNQRVKIPCTIIGGIPTPDVSWHVMKKGEKSFTKLSAAGEELFFDSVALSDAGIYRCEATNVKGQANKNTELVVEKAPEASIIESGTPTVPYGSTNVLTCRVTAFPLPKIVWKDSKGNVLHAKNDINVINNEVISRLTVNNIISSDTYTCHAANDLGQTTISAKVSVLPSIEFPMHLPETIAVKYGDSLIIHCDPKSSMPMKMKWYYQKDEHSPRSEIFTSDKYSISTDERDLRIPSTRLDLAGKYTCEASLVNDEDKKKSFTTNVEINNLKAPEITFSNKTITVEKDGIMSAFCIADGIPKPVVTWQFKSKDSDAFIDVPYEGERIYDPKISYEKAGLYKCTATNALGVQTQTIDVVVHGIPRITNIDTVYYGVTGDKVLKIPCEVDGVPEPTITWRNGGKVVTSDAKLSVTKNALYIKNPTEKDSNNFTCKAKNIYGFDTKHFEADISDFIVYDETYNSNIYLKLGESTDIKCILPHSDPQSIRWYVNGEKTEVLGTFFSIRNAQYSNDGNYTCRLNTEEGSESLNYVVDVGYKPSFKAAALATIDWRGNKEDTLDCDVHAKPSANVEWIYNGQQLDVTWPELAIFGWGQYSCKASNVHDSVQRTFNVTSNGCLINRTAVNVNRIPLLVGEELTSWPELATTNEFYTMSRDESITLECATLEQPDNTFKTIPNVKKIKAKCYSEDQFIVNEIMYKFNNLQCKAYVRPSQVFTNTTCMKKGEVIEVGFKLIEGFLRVYEVCYSKMDRRTLYTKVVMSAVNSGNIVAPSFKHVGIKTGRHGAEPRKCTYTARRLVNPEEVSFGPAQTATLSDQYNAFPVYEPCEGSSRWTWSGVENTVKFALYSFDTVTVWTGASQYDSNGIPRYLWKVVMFDDDTFETIVYVNAVNPNSSDVLCPETIPERLTDVTDAGDQYTYACSMDDFLKAFEVPLTEFTITS